MKNSILALCLSVIGLVGAVSAQEIKSTSKGSATAETSATAQNDVINLESGTRLTAELQKEIDVRKAKVGDEVVLKTTQAVKSKNRTIVAKGARLLGRVTEVAQKSDNGASRVGILFDRLEHGSLAVPIAATITSLTSAAARTRVNNDDIFASDAGASARSTTSASSSGNSGGLLGGVGGVVNSTTSAVGTTVNSTTNAVGNVASGVSRPLAGIQISQSSNTSVQGESVLSLQGGNLRLDKGTRFNLVLTQSASAGTKP
jgi:hypothetical protein